MRRSVLGLVLILTSTESLASDGVLEINQTCAVRTGCFSGDTPGFPVTIDGSAGRSYRLTSDLVVAFAHLDGISVDTNDVGIDLNQFAIRGPVLCSGTPLTCDPVGGGAGVDRTDLANRGISVKNGSIIGMGAGVILGYQAEVLNLRIRSNAFLGIFADSGSIVSGNTVHQNGGGVGISVGIGSTVSGNASFENRGFGISTDSAAVVTGCTVYGNGDHGIHVGPGSTVSNNTASQNEKSGIEAGNGSTLSGNTVANNGTQGIYAASWSNVSNNAVSGNGTIGIRAANGGILSGNTVAANGTGGIWVLEGATVQRNTVNGNGGAGLTLGSQSSYRENTISQNVGAAVTGASFLNMGDNACNGLPTCP